MTISFSRLGRDGRLGNQLFQIAATIAAAGDHRTDYIFPKLAYSSCFEHELPWAEDIRFDVQVQEQQKQGFIGRYIMDRAKNNDLSGYFQSEKWFEGYFKEIREQFTFSAEFMKNILPDFMRPVCAIHVRRGDYVENSAFRTMGMDYYETAMAEMEKLTGKDITFLIFSDDIAWCREHFSRLITDARSIGFTEGLKDIEDLALMSCCDHFIISCSSFGWWGAWLGEKRKSIVIGPAGHWFNPDGPLKDYNTQSVIPERWKRVQAGESEPPAVVSVPLKDLGKIRLPEVTLLAYATQGVEATGKALAHSMRGIEYASCKLIADRRPDDLPAGIEFHQVSPCESLDEWCRRMVYELGGYVETEFVLLVHADGFVVNPGSWLYEFMDYDYIGAPWPSLNHPLYYRDRKGHEIRVGNSVSLRSKRLLDLPKKKNIPWVKQRDGTYHEDTFICCHARHLFEAEGMRFAPFELAKYFSHETMLQELKGIKPFCFHKWAGSNAEYPKF